MHITVWTLATDTDNGTGATVYTSKASAWKAYAGIVCDQEAFDHAVELIQACDTESDATANIAAEDALYTFLRAQHKEEDTYTIEKHQLNYQMPCDLPEEAQAALVETARQNYLRSNSDIDIDDKPFISDSDEGVYVSAWLWVSWSDAGLCSGCKEKKQLGEWTGICAECAKEEEKENA